MKLQLHIETDGDFTLLYNNKEYRNGLFFILPECEDYTKLHMKMIELLSNVSFICRGVHCKELERGIAELISLLNYAVRPVTDYYYGAGNQLHHFARTRCLYSCRNGLSRNNRKNKYI